MNKTIFIQRVVSLINNFYAIGDKSVYELLQEIDYKQFYQSITELDIKNMLKKNPRYIEDWILWSENKRVSSGWFLMKEENSYFVSFLSEKGDVKKAFFEDKYSACANFIINELDSIIREDY